MRFKGPTILRRVMLAAAVFASMFSGAGAQVMVGKLPTPPECSSTKKLSLPYVNHPEKFTAYGKVDLYCGKSTKPIVTGTTLCNSDYQLYKKATQKTANIEVSSKSGKIPSCKKGDDLSFKTE